MRNRFDKKAGSANEVLVIYFETSLVLGEDNVVWSRMLVSLVNSTYANANSPKNGRPSDSSFPEGSIPDRQHTVSEAQDIANHALVRLIKQERLPSFRVQMGMGPEKWRKSTNLIPPHQHLWLRIAKEPSNIS